MATKKPKVVGVRFHLTRNRTHEFSAEVHGKDWKDTAAEYDETNGAEGHNQILRKEDILSTDESEDDETDA